MAENNPSSQESLPLSQETYLQLFRELDGSLSRIMPDVATSNVNGYSNYNSNQHVQLIRNGLHDDDDDEPRSKEALQAIEYNSIIIPPQYTEHDNLQERPISSLPASENWPGTFDFTVSFNPQTVTKKASWIFSDEKRKLYCAKEVPCPVNFSTNAVMPDDVCIRAMALFSSSDNVSENVTRCVNHSVKEIERGVFEAAHFIRSDSRSAHYEEDPVTGRHSVIVQYENPPVGQEYSTYLYKFMCFGSCSGGPNRRPLMVIFTLERRGKVLGRQKIDLKVCACPMRDCRNDENQSQIPGSDENKPFKRPNIDHLTLNLPKKVKTESGKYRIETDDKNCYKFLRKMMRLYMIHSTLLPKYPNFGRLLYSSQSSSGEDC